MASTQLSYWILQTIAMLFTALVLPGLRITSIFGALLTVLLLGLVNATVWDAALFFSVPDSISSHSLVLLLSNAVLFWLLVKVVPGIDISGIVIAIIAPVVFTLFSLYIHTNFADVNWSILFGELVSTLERFRDSLMRGNI